MRREVPVRLSAKERLALEEIAAACDVTRSEVLRHGLRLLMELHEKGIRPIPRVSPIRVAGATRRYRRAKP